MTKKVSRFLVSVIGYPETMDTDMKRAIGNIFHQFCVQVNDVFSDFSVEVKNGVVTIPEEDIRPEFIIRQDMAETSNVILSHYVKKFIVNKQHSIRFGVPRIGLDILIIETDETNENIKNSWLLTNAIPTNTGFIKIEDTPGEFLKVVMEGFTSRNEAVTQLAKRWMEAQHAANTRAKIESENQTSEISATGGESKENTQQNIASQTEVPA